jgi:hypothetical protein
LLQKPCHLVQSQHLESVVAFQNAKQGAGIPVN